MDKLSAMQTFVRVGELKSFSRAADMLGLSRAVVSAQVADLERHLGTQLLHRTTRRVGAVRDPNLIVRRICGTRWPTCAGTAC